MLTQEIETSTLLYQRASKQGAYKKFNHHADFQRRREACSRKKLNIYTFISTRQQARRLQKFNHHADF
ncbi:hypothetical protein VOI46_02380 [Pseudoalteromonas sp. CuT4-3]|uniref:hypothetical protein n=1 Tax=Pseudoalteromonas sp. CuT4-3 TaxID=3112573 RepID=UPI002D768F09|nr:hypothetical protein [Pseudoalteromonas sp. CuT 4-3]MDI3244609.1 hypothetical protein [Pseudoalteromonas agarivorans]WRU73565.1 hypothetical protein VOI46_02380 [Pseudoalteromonas sp. CuT 4-3]